MEKKRITKFVQIKIQEEEKHRKLTEKKTFDMADALLIFFHKTFFFFLSKQIFVIIGILHSNNSLDLFFSFQFWNNFILPFKLNETTSFPFAAAAQKEFKIWKTRFWNIFLPIF